MFSQNTSVYSTFANKASVRGNKDSESGNRAIESGIKANEPSNIPVTSDNILSNVGIMDNNPLHSTTTVMYSHFASLTSIQKEYVLHRLLSCRPTNRVLRILGSLHVGITVAGSWSKDLLLDQFKNHSCTDTCLITVRDAIKCGLSDITSLGTADIRVARQYILARQPTSESGSQQHTACTASAISTDTVDSSNVQQHFVHVQPSILNNYLQQLLKQSSLSLKQLDDLIKLHGCAIAKNRYKKSAITTLTQHVCSPKCLISRADALEGGLPVEFSFQTANIETARLFSSSKRQRQYEILDNDDISDEGRLHSTKRQHIETSPEDWPQILPDVEKINIINDFQDRLSVHNLLRVDCSFCGINEEKTRVHAIPVSDLDISLLNTAIEKLRIHTRQPCIESYKRSTIIDDKYQVCHTCFRSIKHSRFFQIPLYAYSNNCWIGEVPDELQGLSFLEEQCIARARATKCTVKIEQGPTGQYKAKGNVCILPQEPASLQRILPPPINTLTDEIVVIFVATEKSAITSDILRKSPLLVRRSRIINALTWLKQNNPLYQDVDISFDNLMRDYPANDIPKGFAIQEILKNTMTESEGVSYAVEANADLFEDNSSRLTFTSSGIADTESVNATYRLRKLEALRQLEKFQKPFIKFPSANTPLQTWNNPALYTYLWPTLFPYGVGLFEDPIRKDKQFGLRRIYLKQHIRYLLNLKDTRFQTHLTFIYVMMNILQRRTTAAESKLACKRAWFPNVSHALSKISPESLQSFEERLKNDKYIQPESESERAILDILKYVNYISENITGSTAEIHNMREEIRSISREVGLPHLFITINPADFYNPIYQILAGRNIDLNRLFHDMSPHSENINRAKLIAENPVAGAKGFATLMNAFFDILLGTQRNNRLGLFGKVKSYYGVVESQHRGSLHCHLFVWLENGFSPNTVKQKISSDDRWKNKLTMWIESVIAQDFPDNTHPYMQENLPYKQLPIMSTSLDPNLYYNTSRWLQDLRDILENTGQVHMHNNTCFKHLPKIVQKHRDPDRDCRFQLPRPTVTESYFDEDGHLHLKCSNGTLNNYNAICVSCLRCNMDIKYVGSGTAALAMIEYVTNYIAKLSLDTLTVFTALCGAITALSNSPIYNVENSQLDTHENARVLLVKVCNSMIGKRELSGQQVASFLDNLPNHYTNHTFEKIFWTKILRFTAGALFEYTKPETLSETDDNGDSEDEPSQETDFDSNLYMILDNSVVNNAEMIQSHYGASIDDIFYRPHELEHLSLWELRQCFVRIKLPANQSSYAKSNLTTFRFHPKHPLFTTHCLKYRTHRITPVLIGCPVPRHDKPDQIEKYAAAMLTLFKPWSRDLTALLKNSDETWILAFNNYRSMLKIEHQHIINNMQSIYECRDAAHDYSAHRKQRLAELNVQLNVGIDPTDSYEDDPIWSLGMQDAVNTGLNSDNSLENSLQIPLYLSEKEEQQALDFCETAYSANFYTCYRVLSAMQSQEHRVYEGTQIDVHYAKTQYEDLMRQKEHTINLIQNNMSVTFSSDSSQSSLSSTASSAYLTTLEHEYMQIRNRLSQQDPIKWNHLLPYQQICLTLIEKYTLNREQKAAFLLFTNHHGRSMHETLPPIRMLVAGPGGTGKSQIFDAIKDYFRLLKHTHELKVCAPTGLAANNIGGSTIHSEASLRLKKKIHASSQSQNIHTNLEARFHQTTALICDEIYFLGAKDNGTLSENLNIACKKAENSYGNLDLLFAGDPAQLPPPRATSLYNYRALSLYARQDFNMLNTEDKEIAEGIFAWRQFDTCVVLSQIMRQQEKPFQELLQRLRFGICTYQDYSYLQQFIIQNRSQHTNTALLAIENWAGDRDNCSPLICYTNILRDVHNYKSSYAFAQVTGQQYHYYYALDTVRKTKTVLRNAMAEAAWRTPIKQTNDLAGRLPLIPGMPVFLTENLATELGLANGSEGTVVNIKYYTWENRRYAIYATVEFPTYKNPVSNSKQVTIQPTEDDIKFKYPNHDRIYSVKRRQLPLIPAFAYTAHNSQGRSLTRACIDLASCPSTAAAYVMLSRIRHTSGISILRPFRYEKISSHISQEVRDEIKRLDSLHKKTMDTVVTQLNWA